MKNTVELTMSFDMEHDYEPQMVALLVQQAAQVWGKNRARRWALKTSYNYAIVRVFDDNGEYVCES